MSHSSQLRFFEIVRDYFPDHFSESVIDIGSLDINGGPHLLISPKRYVGVDIGEGKNVDVVSRGEDLAFPSGEFDVAMSSECFEHNPQWQGTLHNMIRMTKSSGIIAFTCATIGRAEHGTTRSDQGASAPLATDQGWEYYRNVTKKEVMRSLRGASVAPPYTHMYRPNADLFFLTLKQPASKEDLAQFQECARAVSREFGNPPYTGRFFVRHFAIAVFGDRGGIGYSRLSFTLKGWLRLNK